MQTENPKALRTESHCHAQSHALYVDTTTKFVDEPSMPDLEITVHSSPQKAEIEPDHAYSDLAAVLSAQPMLQLFPWEA